MQKYKSSEDGLVLEGGESNPYTRKSEKKVNKARSSIEKRCKDPLPKRKPRNKYTGRVGKKAAINRKTCFVHLPVTSTTKHRTAFHKETKPAIFPLQTINEEKQKETSNEVDKVEAATARKFDLTSSEKCTKETDVVGKQECDLRMQKENRGEECKTEVSSASEPDVTFTPLSSNYTTKTQ